MAIEIERKFLVVGDGWRTSDGVLYRQGYLNRDKMRTVRVRQAGDQAFLTIKGKTTGISRAEFEYPIPVAEAQDLLVLCDGGLIEKIRHKMTYAGLLWEIDEFLGDNAGLVVAEVELKTAEQAIELPVWVGVEVSDDAKYYNSNLSTYPFSSWMAQDAERMLERSGVAGIA
jgi:CYTH domain-containing protein